MSQRYRVPVGVLVLIGIGIVALVSIDVAVVTQDPTRFRADLRLMFGIATTGAALWLTARLIRTWIEQTNHRLRDIEIVLAREGPTIPMRIVGTAALPAERMIPPAFDPKVIELGQHIARKIADEN